MPAAAATAAAIDNCGSSDSSAARAASAAATATCSERSSISAHMCLTAWKLPIGLPNCSRTFAYSVAVCSVHRANPAASAASTVAATSSTRRLDTGRTSAAASVEHHPGQRAGEVGGGQRFDRDTVGGGVDQKELGIRPGKQQHPTRIGAQHVLGGARCPAAVVFQVGGQRHARRCARRTPAPPAGRPANSGRPAWQRPWSRSDREPSRRPPRRPSRTGRRRCRRRRRTLRAAPLRRCPAAPGPHTALATLRRHPARPRGRPRRHWTPQPSYGPVHVRQTARRYRSLTPATSSGLLCLRARRACFSLERVLIVPVFERQVERHYSRTRRCRHGR